MEILTLKNLAMRGIEEPWIQSLTQEKPDWTNIHNRKEEKIKKS